MGWIRTFKSIFFETAESVTKVPSILKKKVVRSKHVRNILVGKLGTILTSLVEMHVLAVLCIGLKWTTISTIQFAYQTFLTQFLEQESCIEFPIMGMIIYWCIDIVVPVFFSLHLHQSFVSFICWMFETPLYSLAKRIQYMRPNDIYQFYRIKYSILLPVLLYLSVIVYLVPVSKEFVYICLLQTCLIQLLTDFWPLRHELLYAPCYNTNTKASFSDAKFEIHDDHLEISANVEELQHETRLLYVPVSGDPFEHIPILQKKES